MAYAFNDDKSRYPLGGAIATKQYRASMGTISAGAKVTKEVQMDVPEGFKPVGAMLETIGAIAQDVTNLNKIVEAGCVATSDGLLGVSLVNTGSGSQSSVSAVVKVIFVKEELFDKWT